MLSHLEAPPGRWLCVHSTEALLSLALLSNPAVGNTHFIPFPFICDLWTPVLQEDNPAIPAGNYLGIREVAGSQIKTHKLLTKDFSFDGCVDLGRL